MNKRCAVVVASLDVRWRVAHRLRQLQSTLCNRCVAVILQLSVVDLEGELQLSHSCGVRVVSIGVGTISHCLSARRRRKERLVVSTPANIPNRKMEEQPNTRELAVS